MKIKLLMPLLLSLGAGVSLAGGDPTQPPSIFVEPTSGSASGEGGSPVRLQSVIIRPGKKSVALIDGTTYQLGEKLGEMRIIKITERSVTLRGVQGKEELFLTPDVEVTPVKRKSAINRSDKS
jgi:hypothetical protein